MSNSVEVLKAPYTLHVLVCTNTRTEPAGKPSCGPLGGDNVRAELKKWLHEEVSGRPRLSGKIKVRVNGSGCLDFCKRGIVVAIYPANEFLLFVKNDLHSIATVKDEILKKLAELEAS